MLWYCFVRVALISCSCLLDEEGFVTAHDWEPLGADGKPKGWWAGTRKRPCGNLHNQRYVTLPYTTPCRNVERARHAQATTCLYISAYINFAGKVSSYVQFFAVKFRGQIMLRKKLHREKDDERMGGQ